MNKALVALLLLCLMMVSGGKIFAQPALRLDRANWEIGEVREGTLLKQPLLISNKGNEVLKINARSSCSCVYLDRGEKEIAPGKSASLTISFDTKGKNGKVTEYVFLDTNDPSHPHIIFVADGNIAAGKGVTPETKKAEKPVRQEEEEGGVLELELFSGPHCATCERIKNVVIKRLAKKYDLNIGIKSLELDKPENYERLVALEEKYNDRHNRIPLLFVGGQLLGGEKEIRKNLEGIFRRIAEKGYESPEARGEDSSAAHDVAGRFESMRVLPIIGAGLIDGINPCAFATIIFFISYLSFAGRSGREILCTGISFTFAVFLCYLLIGLGVLKVVSVFSRLVIISKVIKWATAAVVFVLAGLSIYDYAKCRQGKVGEMKLQLSPLLKEKIHKTIVSRRTEFSDGKSGILKPAVAGFTAGFLVSFFEFACTGQIYLPTIIYMLGIPQKRLGGLAYLVLYNLMCVVPLIVVFILAFKGMTSEKLSDFMMRHISKVKAGMAVFFFLMGVFLLAY